MQTAAHGAGATEVLVELEDLFCLAWTMEDVQEMGSQLPETEWFFQQEAKEAWLEPCAHSTMLYRYFLLRLRK